MAWQNFLANPGEVQWFLWYFTKTVWMPLNLKLKVESSSCKLKHSKTKIKKKMFAWAPGKNILSFTCWHWKSRSLHTLQFHFNLSKNCREGCERHLCYIFDLPKRGGMKETKENEGTVSRKKRKVKWDDYRQMRIRIKKQPTNIGKKVWKSYWKAGNGNKKTKNVTYGTFLWHAFFLKCRKLSEQ